MRFEDLIQAPELLDAVRELGWRQPTPIQEQAIPPARQGRDLVGIAQTGTGKTGAFLLPLLERQLGQDGLRTLVLCPTRELAQQVAADARALSRHTDFWVGEVVGGLPMGKQIRELRAGVELLVATPGRLIDHLQRGTVDLSGVRALVLDEADRMLDMGFRPQIEQVLAACPRQRQTLLFSATMANGVHALALRILRDPVRVEAAPSATAAAGVEQLLYPVRPERKLPLLLHLLEQPGMDQVLVFTRTRRGADRLATQLEAAGVSITVLHGDRDMGERRGALDAFASGAARVLVATDVAQRGLDIEGISHVVNYDVPLDPEDYVHRIGRTGRAGATGQAVTFQTAAELGQVRGIERLLGYRIARVSLQAFDYAGGGAARPEPARTNRSGSRFGTRRTDALSPEQLAELLRVG
ncbi:MAG: DEAD/DEAH box helicase [Gemmatimonadetes bacterium]|nr:DEAD/DEAH box helicase [Gemmatimonadota bacterium]